MCDAVNTNRCAVNVLINPKLRGAKTAGSFLEYTMNGSKIWHIFDSPHLIKSIRNNLLVKNLIHTASFNELKFKSTGEIVWNEKNKKLRTASWTDVKDFYKFNSDDAMFNLIPKITENHINPTRKMKVNLATQVLSGTFGRNMYLCSKRKQFSNDCLGTAAVLLFFNQLFDSVNGDGVPNSNKPMASLSKNSNHFAFWNYAIRVLETMTFTENLTTGKPNKSAVCKHFVSTLKGLQQVSVHLLELGIATIGLRRLNQDGLENHFFKIRSYCGSNQKPNARDFRSSYTTSILNLQLTNHSMNANCERDDDKYLLRNLKTLLAQENKTTIYSVTQKASEVPTFVIDSFKNDQRENTFCENQALNCVSRKICTEMLKKYKCDPCSCTITTTAKEKSKDHEIMRKQSSGNNEAVPKVEFIARIKVIVSEVKKILPTLCVEKNLAKTLMSGIT